MAEMSRPKNLGRCWGGWSVVNECRKLVRGEEDYKHGQEDFIERQDAKMWVTNAR